MLRILKTVLVFILLSNLNFAQEVSISKIALQHIPVTIKVTGIPDTISAIIIKISNPDIQHNFELTVLNGIVDTSISIPGTGNYSVEFPGYEVEKTSLRVLPGLFSIIPPLLAIFLALLLRQVIISLVLGVYVGSVLVYDYNIITGFVRLIDTYIVNALVDESHIQIIVFTFLFGGMIGLISKSGGTRGIANVLSGFARTRRSGMISTWLSGLIIFFDDYANSLIVGNLMRPLTDKMRISREKLAFIVDATAAPVASIMIVSSWIGYEIGLIQDGLRIIGSTENAYDIFLQTIPYRFYPILMLIFVFMIAYTQRDFGLMHKAEKRAVEEGKVSADDKNITKNLSEVSEIFGNEDKARWYNGIIPVGVMIFGTIAALYYTGVTALTDGGVTDYSFRDIIGNSDPYKALLWSSFSACVVAGLMILSQRIMSLSETIDAWFIGIRSMMLALLILTLAWAIGAVTVEIKTADYIVSMIDDSINPRFLPVIVFLACALTSFSTGTSWGTMAIMMPIAIPLAHSVSGIYNFSDVDSMIILHGVISSVLAGSVFGDHCSPIADTTILSSMASGCDHMDHVRTQLPYAILVGVLCMLLGDIPTAYGFSPYLSVLIISGILALVLYFFGKKPGTVRQ